MENNILSGKRYDEIQSDIIKANILNKDDVLKTEAEDSFEEEVKKGEVEVISLDDIKDTYGNQFYKGEDVALVEKNIDALIEKGEKEYLTEGEAEDLEKAIAEVKQLERKAIAVPRGDSHVYKEVFVTPAAEVEGEE